MKLSTVLLATLVLLPSTGTSQSFRVRGVNLLSGPEKLDYYLDNNATPVINDLLYEYASPLGTLPVGGGSYIVRISPDAGLAGAIKSTPATVQSGYDYAAVAYGTRQNPFLTIISHSRSDNPGAGHALVRVMNALSFSSPIDVYVDSITGPPVFRNLATGAITGTTEFSIPQPPAQVFTLFITRNGEKTIRARLNATINSGTYETMIVTGIDITGLKVYQLDESNTSEHKLPALTTREGNVPALRVVHALPGESLRKLDVYAAGILQASRLLYRSASGEFGGALSGETSVLFRQAGSLDNVYVAPSFALNEDTAYTVVLSKYTTGTPVSATLTRDLNIPNTNIGEYHYRTANATDYYGTLQFHFFSDDTDTGSASLPFLGASAWSIANSGNIHVQVYKIGIAAPVFEGTANLSGGNFYTFIAIGNDSAITIDILNESLPATQQTMESFGTKEAGVGENPSGGLSLVVVPNPARDYAQVRVESEDAKEIYLVDAMGRRLISLQCEPGETSVRIPVAGLACGAYTIAVRSGAVVSTARFVIAR